MFTISELDELSYGEEPVLGSCYMLSYLLVASSSNGSLQQRRERTNPRKNVESLIEAGLLIDTMLDKWLPTSIKRRGP